MINTTAEYKQAMKEGKRALLAKASCLLKNGTMLNFDHTNIMVGGLSITDGVCSSGNFDLGSAIINQLTLKINNMDEEYSSYDFTDAQITVWEGAQLSSGPEWLKKGVFNASDPTETPAVITLKALDNMAKFDSDYDCNMTFPITIQAMVQYCCDRCGVILATQLIPNGKYVIHKNPFSDAQITYRTIISHCAVIAGCFARCNADGQLELKWYDKTAFSEASKHHEITQIASGLSVMSVDVTITGIKVTSEGDEKEKETYLSGTEGYVLSVSGNPLIQPGDTKTIASYLAEKNVGMRFRPMKANAVGDPSWEAGDAAVITDRKGKKYNCYLTNIAYVIGQRAVISCDAQPASRKSADRYDKINKVIAEIKKNVQSQLTEYGKYFDQMNSLAINAMGYYETVEIQDDGSKITYMHDKPNLSESKTVYKKSIDGYFWSNDGGKTWTSGIDKNGNAVMNVIAAIGLHAEWIKAGKIQVEDSDGKIIFLVDMDTKKVIISGDSIQIGSRPIEEVINNGILESKNYADKLGGNLLKGAAFGENDIKTYWDVAGKIEHDIEDPSGGVYAIRLTGTVSDNFVSAKYSNNNPINTAGWYEVRVWLKAEKDMSVTISANRVAYKCAVTTKWQQFRIMLPVSTPNTQGFQNFTIGGWGSIPKDAVVYIYRPEISYSYSPDDMLDILTENGKRKGIYSKNGMLYIDGTYIRSGKVSGEYIDARNLTVTNTAGQKTIAVDNTGNVDMNVRSLSILGSAIASEAYADRQSGNLLKGGNLTESDIGQYWETHGGDVTYGQADPLGGKSAIKFYSPIMFDDGSGVETAYLSAKKSTNNPITAPGVYEARFWLKANVNKTIKISINRTQYDCAVTTSWKQYRYMLDVKTPNTTIYPSFTIGGWNSMGMDETYYIYKPEVIISYSPTDILNLLTNNGAMDGVFIRNGQLYVKGSYIDVDDLKALKATIGGFAIGASGIYKGCTSLTSTVQGVYIGTNGIRLYATDNNSNETSFTFDLAKRTAALIGTSLLFKMRNFSEKAELSGADGTVTCKYGLHVYTKRGPDIADGSYDSELVFKGLPHITSGTTLVRESGSARVCTSSSSSKRYKDHVATLKDSEAEKLLDIPVVWFKYKEGYLAKEDRFVDKPLPGFYAEDVFHAFPECAMQNPDTSVEDWNYRTLIPPMLKLIQNLYKEVKTLKENAK